MAAMFDRFSDLHRPKLSWRFRMYVKRIYEHYFPGSDGFTLEIVLQDSECVRVHASIPKALVNRWLGVIKEFKMYEMFTFIVVDKKCYIRTIRVEPVEEPSFPLDVFNFKPFNELLHAESVDENEMFDIIGEVVGKEDPREVVLVKRLVVVLEDLGSNRLCCALFGNLVDQILSMLKEDNVELVIIVLQYFRPTRWNDITSIQSNFDVSGMYINPDLKIVDEFRQIIITWENYNGVCITQVESQDGISNALEFKMENVFISIIDDVFNAEEV
ncbi:hypothetical protein PIB30_040330 [Stylosanthes scabra]|uniref:Replication protein A 70 kDa DNA-binding subunit B/D first OB fold domain-containing protein n=1 Tax=Stylosanthes scabra TaxID=79078 RepID=A0ABU6TEV6_9FABA|nr:hypothetical protein [Stylosanthes scabra]